MPGAPAPFDDALVAEVADEHGLEPDALAALLERHQALCRFGVRTLEDTLYGWRTGMSGDPLVARAADVVTLDGPDFAWTDLLDWPDIDLDSDEATAIRATHARQFERDVESASMGPS
jgi:hypothetical protein